MEAEAGVGQCATTMVATGRRHPPEPQNDDHRHWKRPINPRPFNGYLLSSPAHGGGGTVRFQR